MGKASRRKQVNQDTAAAVERMREVERDLKARIADALRDLQEVRHFYLQTLGVYVAFARQVQRGDVIAPGEVDRIVALLEVSIEKMSTQGAA